MDNLLPLEFDGDKIARYIDYGDVTIDIEFARLELMANNVGKSALILDFFRSADDLDSLRIFHEIDGESPCPPLCGVRYSAHTVSLQGADVPLVEGARSRLTLSFSTLEQFSVRNV